MYVAVDIAVIASCSPSPCYSQLYDPAERSDGTTHPIVNLARFNALTRAITAASCGGDSITQGEKRTSPATGEWEEVALRRFDSLADFEETVLRQSRRILLEKGALTTADAEHIECASGSWLGVCLVARALQ